MYVTVIYIMIFNEKKSEHSTPGQLFSTVAAGCGSSKVRRDDDERDVITAMFLHRSQRRRAPQLRSVTNYANSPGTDGAR